MAIVITIVPAFYNLTTITTVVILTITIIIIALIILILTIMIIKDHDYNTAVPSMSVASTQSLAVEEHQEPPLRTAMLMGAASSGHISPSTFVARATFSSLLGLCERPKTSVSLGLRREKTSEIGCYLRVGAFESKSRWLTFRWG